MELAVDLQPQHDSAIERIHISMDPSTSVTSTVSSNDSRRRLFWKSGLVGTIVLLCVAAMPLRTRRHFSCAVCGMQRQVEFTLSLPIGETDTETDCCRWYDQNVEPQHDHVWVRGPWSETFSVLGLRLYESNISSAADGPLMRFGSGTRHLMYQRCADPKIARDTFVRLARWEPEGSAERKQQIAIERALAAWEDSGLVGPWPIPDQHGERIR